MQFFSCFGCGKGLDRKKKVKAEQSWRIFSLKELHAATNSFNYDNKLGEGRFGSVYWGQLWDGSQIAVKRLKAWSNREEIDFAVEAEVLARIRHKNLLSLRGYCAEGQERLIVYLHHFATPRIVHGDVRASNVLLDSEFEARVSDFGYSKMMPEDGAAKTTKNGINNLGYLSPECVESGKESDLGDVYSFGVVLLELVTGKRPIEKLNQTTKRGITEWVLPLVYDRKFGEIVDQRLNGKFVEEELKRVVLIGLMCAQSEPEKRPTMSEVVEMLMNGSKEKMSYLEAHTLFNRSNGRNVINESSEIISEEEDHQKQEQE
ncbi:unnamed protein product [Thlaspi arvense]|uniref:Protein kinase domain-containing protein n=1 Tax=Thlaspi arvense TaxID=13288 RepID=A0AAU9R9I5_THLAR|nr:unnamed protein product [Thlaspi arvense]